jgi:hypothetical protein
MALKTKQKTKYVLYSKMNRAKKKKTRNVTMYLFHLHVAYTILLATELVYNEK